LQFLKEETYEDIPIVNWSLHKVEDMEVILSLKIIIFNK